MKNDFTHVSIVLDRSGSMADIASDTIGGFNQFITSQRALPGECTVTLVQFDTQAIDTVFNALSVREVQPLTSATFKPRGGTPLYDAIAHTINATGKFLKDKSESERPAKVVFVIITDGFENSSREFDRERVFQMIKHQREAYKWEFVFIGANQDALAVGQSIGVIRQNCLTNVANADGIKSSYGALSSNMQRMRSAPVGGVCCSMSFSDEQREEQEKAALKKLKK